MSKRNGASTAAGRTLTVDLKVTSLVEYEHVGYVPSRPEVHLTPSGAEAVKRLSITLDQRGETLSDGTLVKNSVPKTIAWLCERLADAV